MTKAREQQVSLSDTCYYHCVARCVRRAFMCGKDEANGKDFSHRKQWIVDKIKELSAIYAIDVCAYAVMSNHYHVVLHVDEVAASRWSDKEVIKRWYQLFNGNMLVDRFKKDELRTKAEKDAVNDIIAEWRSRLMSISWFMRCLNESIARQANQEDNCTGRFWEGRFKSQALLDETAVLSCMMYVDLNPIRAGMSETLEESEFTFIQERLVAFAETKKPEEVTQNDSLMLFKGGDSRKNDTKKGIAFDLLDYFELIDWTGRVIREDKHGAIPPHIQPILQKLGIKENAWVNHVQHFGRRYYKVIGPLELLQKFSENLGQWWMQGKRSLSEIYSPA